ncbi:hypothetical protein GQ42DRAFT_160017 [Ramicandelaber brevisporus]|nr:hypothetical protein GQ42DRAFT_160017 [Ramicandelaber brevisporus]
MTEHSITALPQISEDSVARLLEKRHKEGQAYTALGSSVLVAVNPSHLSAGHDDALSARYSELYKQADVNTTLPPHPYAVANNAYLHMRRLGQDQSIVLAGLSGSGKSTTRDLIINHLFTLAGSAKKENKVHALIQAANSVITAFGTVATPLADRATKHGLYQEIQFSDRGRIVGAKSLAYMLDRARVTHQPADESNFVVFYDLLGGATSEERTRLSLLEPQEYVYLRNSSSADGSVVFPPPPAGGNGAAAQMNELKAALRLLGVKTRVQSQIFQLLAAILHIGNIEFIEDAEIEQAQAAVKNHEQLAIAAQLLGLPPAALEELLTFKTKLIGREMCTVQLDVAGAAKQRDLLARVLYSLLFSSLVETINKKLCLETTDGAKAGDDAAAGVVASNHIAILDQFGFHPPAGRSHSLQFDAFCVNAANEKLHWFFIRDTLGAAGSPLAATQSVTSGIDAEMAADGVAPQNVPAVSVIKDLLQTADLLFGTDGTATSGLAGVIDDHTTDNAESASNDQRLLTRIARSVGSHPAFVPSTGASPQTTVSASSGSARSTFTIRHFGVQSSDGPATGCGWGEGVSYNIDGFCSRNTETSIGPDVVNAFSDAGRNVFINSLFDKEAGTGLTTKQHPHDPNTVIAATQSARPMRRPTTRRAANKGAKSKAAASQSSEPSSTVMQLHSTLQDVLAAIGETRIWYIVHIRPHLSTVRGGRSDPHVDGDAFRRQIRALGILPVAQRRRLSGNAEYSISFHDHEFITRYQEIAGFASDADRSAIMSFLATQGITEDSQTIVQGTTMVFLTEVAWRHIEDQLRLLERDLRANDKARQVAAVMAVSAHHNAATNADDSASLVSAAMGGPSASGSGNAASERELVQYASSNAGGRVVGPNRRFMGAYIDDDDASLAGDLNRRDSHLLGGSVAGDAYGADADNEKAYANVDAYGNAVGGTRGDIGNGDKDGDGVKGGPETLGVETLDAEREISGARKCWVRTTWLLTWWVPSPIMKCCGMKRQDVRMAWREKFSICLLIMILWGALLFMLIGLSQLMCPPSEHKFFTAEDVCKHQGNDDLWVHIRGNVYDLSGFGKQTHGKIQGLAGAGISDFQEMRRVTGSQCDFNLSFPIPVRSACPDLVGADKDPNYQYYLAMSPDEQLLYNDFQGVNGVHLSGPRSPFSAVSSKLSNTRFFQDVAQKYMDQQMWKAHVVYSKQDIEDMRKKDGKLWRIIKGNVFSLDTYDLDKDDANSKARGGGFLDQRVYKLFTNLSNNIDVTDEWNKLPSDIIKTHGPCLSQLFYKGRLDTRNSFKCLFPYWLLLGAAIIMMLVVLIKFLASLQLTSKRRPQKHDKFVICQVTCYTEGEESLRNTIDSIAQLKYDDKHKLIFVVADGMIIGSGNDKPTPRIVLDILGVDPAYDPPALSFKSLGEGAKQHNMGKVYSGLYECEGHVVPYVVLVKVGKPSERSRPGNRGKRDSQIQVLDFLNRVHYDREMSPLQLEIYHQMKNVIGVHPGLYEYLLMIDADTKVDSESLARLVACCVRDSRVIGICGETRLSNEDNSWTTMMQVYEYFISHHMAKAFESIFGSVTCLPGCFSMYRLRTNEANPKPLIIHDNVVKNYSENIVDTLHMKNLLSLGEDRYLTTLMMRYFSQYKMTFTADAKCETVAPEKWSVLLSQRRRWINSTVHNLVELYFLPEMCGFCCFSMRFVVFLDLFGTLTLPVTLVYLVYLLYLAITGANNVGYVSLYIIAAVYGLQAIIFILKRQWQHVGWMIIYLLAFPLYSFFIPIYSFWHFDDFSWGNTRVVVGDGKKQIYVIDEGHFNPEDVPMRKFADFEADMIKRAAEEEATKAGMVGSSSMSQFGGYTPGVGGFAGADDTRSIRSGYSGYNAGSVGIPAPQLSLIDGGDGIPRPGSRAAVARMIAAEQAAAMSMSQYNSSRPGSVMMVPPINPFTGNDPRRQSQFSMNHMGTVGAMAGTPLPAYDDPTDDLPVGVMMSHATLPQVGGGIAPIDPQQPTDDELLQQIRTILSSANLATVTKKSVRVELQQFFGVDLSARKNFIHQSIEMILSGAI